MDKAIIRFFAVQMYDPFIKDIKSIKKDKTIKGLIDQLLSSSVSSIILPSNFETIIHQNIEMIFHKSIMVKGKDIAPDKLKDSIVLDDVWVNWDAVKSGVTSAYRNQKPSRILKMRFQKKNFSKQEKARIALRPTLQDTIALQVDLILKLMEMSFPLIEKYIPLEEYGLPSLKLMELMMNRVIGEKFDIKDNETGKYSTVLKMGDEAYEVDLGPRFNRMHDIYGLQKDYEIHYLRKKIKELKPDIDLVDEMLKDGFSYHQHMLEKIIKKQDPVFYVSFDTNFRKKNLENKAFLTNLGDFIKDFQNNLTQDISIEMGSEVRLKTLAAILGHINTYFDLRFNKKYGYEEIQHRLQIAHFETVWRDIQNLAERIGFVEENNQIDKNRSQ